MCDCQLISTSTLVTVSLSKVQRIKLCTDKARFVYSLSNFLQVSFISWRARSLEQPCCPSEVIRALERKENMPNGDLEHQVRVPQEQKRRQQSYENVNEQDDVPHEYDKLVDVRGRNRTKCSPGPSKPTEGDGNRNAAKISEETDYTDGNRPRTPSRIFKILNCTGCLLSMAAIILVILLMAGVVPVRNCGDCQNVELLPGQEQEVSTNAPLTQDNLHEVVRELKLNLSKVNTALKKRDEKIASLQEQGSKRAGQIAELQRKFTYRVYVINNTVINITDSGSIIDLNTGKMWHGNMTSCRYKRKEGVSFTIGDMAMGNVVVTERTGYRIVGVTCSTIGASEYNLKSEINHVNLRRYECECRGRSTLFIKPKTDRVGKCIMHYWVCTA